MKRNLTRIISLSLITSLLCQQITCDWGQFSNRNLRPHRELSPACALRPVAVGEKKTDLIQEVERYLKEIEWDFVVNLYRVSNPHEQDTCIVGAEALGILLNRQFNISLRKEDRVHLEVVAGIHTDSRIYHWWLVLVIDGKGRLLMDPTYTHEFLRPAPTNQINQITVVRYGYGIKKLHLLELGPLAIRWLLKKLTPMQRRQVEGYIAERRKKGVSIIKRLPFKLPGLEDKETPESIDLYDDLAGRTERAKARVYFGDDSKGAIFAWAFLNRGGKLLKGYQQCDFDAVAYYRGLRDVQLGRVHRKKSWKKSAEVGSASQVCSPPLVGSQAIWSSVLRPTAAVERGAIKTPHPNSALWRELPATAGFVGMLGDVWRSSLSYVVCAGAALAIGGIAYAILGALKKDVTRKEWKKAPAELQIVKSPKKQYQLRLFKRSTRLYISAILSIILSFGSQFVISKVYNSARPQPQANIPAEILTTLGPPKEFHAAKETPDPLKERAVVILGPHGDAADFETDRLKEEIDKAQATGMNVYYIFEWGGPAQLLAGWTLDNWLKEIDLHPDSVKAWLDKNRHEVKTMLEEALKTGRAPKGAAASYPDYVAAEVNFLIEFKDKITLCLEDVSLESYKMRLKTLSMDRSRAYELFFQGRYDEYIAKIGEVSKDLVTYTQSRDDGITKQMRDILSDPKAFAIARLGALHFGIGSRKEYTNRQIDPCGVDVVVKALLENRPEEEVANCIAVELPREVVNIYLVTLLSVYNKYDVATSWKVAKDIASRLTAGEIKKLCLDLGRTEELRKRKAKNADPDRPRAKAVADWLIRNIKLTDPEKTMLLYQKSTNNGELLQSPRSLLSSVLRPVAMGERRTVSGLNLKTPLEFLKKMLIPGRSYSLMADLSGYSPKILNTLFSSLILFSLILGVIFRIAIGSNIWCSMITVLIATFTIDASTQYFANKKVDFSQSISASLFFGALVNGTTIYLWYDYLTPYSYAAKVLGASAYAVLIGAVYVVTLMILHNLPTKETSVREGEFGIRAVWDRVKYAFTLKGGLDFLRHVGVQWLSDVYTRVLLAATSGTITSIIINYYTNLSKQKRPQEDEVKKYIERLTALMDEGRFDEALTHIKKGQDLPLRQFLTLKVSLIEAQALFELGQNDEALEVIEEKILDRKTLVRRYGEFSSWEDSGCRQLLRNAAILSIKVWQGLATEKWSGRGPQELGNAREQCRRAIKSACEIDPDNISLYMLSANALLSLSFDDNKPMRVIANLEEAFRLLDRAEGLLGRYPDKDMTNINCIRAKLHMRLGGEHKFLCARHSRYRQSEEAEESHGKAIQAYETAIRILEGILESGKPRVDVYMLLAKACQGLGEVDYTPEPFQKALGAIRTALELDPQDLDVYRIGIHVVHSAEEIASLEKELMSSQANRQIKTDLTGGLLRISPANLSIPAQFKLGWTLHDFGFYEEAMVVAEGLLRRKPDDKKAAILKRHLERDLGKRPIIETLDAAVPAKEPTAACCV